MLKCEQLTEKTSAYIDGELSFVERLDYRMHLLLCHRCRRFVHNFKAGITMLKRVYRDHDHNNNIERLCQHVHSLPRE